MCDSLEGNSFGLSMSGTLWIPVAVEWVNLSLFW